MSHIAAGKSKKEKKNVKSQIIKWHLLFWATIFSLPHRNNNIILLAVVQKLEIDDEA